MSKFANLLSTDDAFDAAFKQNHQEDKMAIKITGGNSKKNQNGPQDHIETLMQMSRQFVVKGRMHLYSDNEAIFFQREPTFKNKQSHNCKTCDSKFENVK